MICKCCKNAKFLLFKLCCYYKKNPTQFCKLEDSAEAFLKVQAIKANPGKLEKMSVWGRLFLFKIEAKEREKFGQRAQRDIKGDKLFSTPRC